MMPPPKFRAPSGKEAKIDKQSESSIEVEPKIEYNSTSAENSAFIMPRANTRQERNPLYRNNRWENSPNCCTERKSDFISNSRAEALRVTAPLPYRQSQNLSSYKSRNNEKRNINSIPPSNHQQSKITSRNEDSTIFNSISERKLFSSSTQVLRTAESNSARHYDEKINNPNWNPPNSQKQNQAKHKIESYSHFNTKRSLDKVMPSSNGEEQNVGRFKRRKIEQCEEENSNELSSKLHRSILIRSSSSSKQSNNMLPPPLRAISHSSQIERETSIFSKELQVFQKDVLNMPPNNPKNDTKIPLSTNLCHNETIDSSLSLHKEARMMLPPTLRPLKHQHGIDNSSQALIMPLPSKLKRGSPSDQVTRANKSSPQIADRNDSSNVNQNQNNPDKDKLMTHVIFCIDNSGSMKINDVKVEQNKQTTRWNAVFSCAKAFVQEQVSNTTQNSDNVEFSLIIFNTEANLIFQDISCGDGEEIQKQLEQAKKNYPPQQGTLFSPALELVHDISNGYGGPVMVIFLSDGRPADLPRHVNAIPPNYRYHKKIYASAGIRLKNLRKLHKERLSLQFICIYEEGKPWLQRLANSFDGTFHMSKLDLFDDNIIVHSTAPVTTEEECASSRIVESHDTEIKVLETKGLETQYRERYKEAKKSQNVIDLTSSMRTTFSTISNTLTTMRSTYSNANKLKDRSGIILEPIRGTSETVTYQATRMILNLENTKFEVPSTETTINERIVKLATQPFAQGGLRIVYQMTELHSNLKKMFRSNNLVAKESRHVIQYKERLRFHQETIKCQKRAIEFTQFFNSGSKSLHLIPKVNFLTSEVYRLYDENAPGKYRYLAVEECLPSMSYIKFNNNNGYVVMEAHNYDLSKANKIAQAFSHYTFDQSKEREIVVDIQGNNYLWTDPQLHSINEEYGRADRGRKGIDDFFKTHVCNIYCRAHSLRERVGDKV